MIDESLSRAVLAYVGTPGHLSGVAEERVVEVMGDAGLDLIPRVKLLMDDLYGAEPPLCAAESLEEIGRRVESWLRLHRPELSDEAIRKLVNRYTFDFK